MTPTFDFAAFLNSPTAGNDGSNSLTVAGPATESPTFSNDFDAFDSDATPFGPQSSFDTNNLLPDWASSAIDSKSNDALSSVKEEALDSDALMDAGSTTQKPATTNYRSKIAAHHFSQLRHWLPQLGGGAGGTSAGLGGAGQRSNGGSMSSPSVPLSQAGRSRAVKRAAECTIQERRRLSRRGHAAGFVHPSVSRMIPKLSADDATTKPLTHSPSKASVYNSKYSNLDSGFIKRAYSYTGFDMIGALMKVAQRENPKIEIGPVDLSCSFTVSDAQHPEQPIVYCSDTFCHLTGYDREEIIGRNCRFLQAPGGQVEKGSERVHTDNGAVSHFRKHCQGLQECQTSLINYRRDGSPFINLVTIVPITWGDSTEPVFLIGFQVDLVEQPGAVLERAPNGLYTVNYSGMSNNGAPSLHALTEPHMQESVQTPAKDPVEAEESKQAMMAHELSELIGSGSEDTSQWARVLLDNSHDLIHVLSLKGTFLYVSPSVERLLGYKAEEMVGKSISEFCHPSDVVPVFRELKDSTSNASIASAARQWARMDGTVNPITKGGAGQTGPQVNLIMRMRHKTRGHEWIENVGKLHLEQGKGRKVVISTGRARPVYNLPWEQARRSLDHKGPGFWSKVSSEGLILSTSGAVGDVLDSETSRSNDENRCGATLAGMHLTDLVNSEAMEAISTGLHSLNVSGIPHTMTDRVGGQATTVMSTLIPSSAGGEGLPTVFVHTQRVSLMDLGQMQLNKVHSQTTSAITASDASQAALLKKGEPLGNSVFGELSTQRSSSWVFELHQLKIANKRLKQEIRVHQRRLSSSPLKIRMQHKPTIGRNSLSASGNGSGSASEMSTEPSISPVPAGFESGSGTDSTMATSVADSGVDNPSMAGVKRSRV